MGGEFADFLAIVAQPFLPFSSQRLWENLGQSGDVSKISWYSAIDWKEPMTWNDDKIEPLFQRLDLEQIMAQEQSLISNEEHSSDVGHAVKGGKKKGSGNVEKEVEGITYLDFNDFMKVELKVGKIISVEDHPNADKLYVVRLDDGTENGRTICAGLKEYYQPSEMVNKSVVFVANLKPRPLRGITSEGMMLAADDNNGNVKLVDY